jgi:hypothetical protein
MKLRLNASSVRLRCGISEVGQFATTRRVETVTHFPNGRELTVALTAAETGGPCVDFSGDRIEVSVPLAEWQRWTETEDVGMYGRHGQLDILIEKDFRRTSKASPDDADRYPHPGLS